VRECVKSFLIFFISLFYFILFHFYFIFLLKNKNQTDARVQHVDSEMPVDPYEPTYCTCNRVSFGEMVGCDNQDCKIEWFHFECVGLTNPPKGKWYCPDCTALRKKNKQ